MFKNYLTFQFAVSFDQACALIPLPIPKKSELQRCSRAMLNQFTRSLQTQDPLERSKCLFVSLTYLRDCGDLLKEVTLEAQAELQDITPKYEILNLRFERLCWEASSTEGGQLRMFG